MLFPSSTDFSSLIGRLADALRQRGLGFMLIGGQAVLVHGQPRLTQDIDITLAASPERLADVLDVCRDLGLTALPEDRESFVAETFVLPASDRGTGIRVDFVFSSTSYEKQAIERAVHVAMGGTEVPFASAEDLILHKVFAARPRDIEDAAGVVRRKGSELDWEYIHEWGARFSELPGYEDVSRSLRELQDSTHRTRR
jgi:predicted nucleotidyltransferase